jgi:hypothetical protein
MSYRLRGFLQITILRARLRPQYVFALAGVVLGLVLAVAQPPWEAAGPLLVLSLAAFAIALLTFALDTRALWRAGRRSVLSVVERGPQIDAMELGDACHDYSRGTFHGQRYAFDPHVDDRLAAQDVPLRIRGGRFELPERFAEHAPVVLAAKWRRGVALFNSRLARLATDLTEQQLAAEVQDTDYFAGECTNEMVGLDLYRRDARGRSRLELSGATLLGSAGIVSDLNDSSCANIVGISTLAFTRDRKLVVVTQSGRSAQSAHQLAPSGSGSADPEDYVEDGRPVATLQRFVARAMRRELVEECGLDGPAAPDVRTLVLGYARVLTRGGKPEFFGVSAIDVDFETLVISRRERTYVSAIDPSQVKLRSASDLLGALQAYRGECGDRFSLALHLNLAVLERFAGSRWKRLEGLLVGGDPGH